MIPDEQELDPKEADRQRAIVDRWLAGGQGQSLTGAAAQAKDVDPDRAGKVRQLQRGLNLPYDVVERNYEELSKRYQVESLPVDQIQEQSPHLAAWASSPDNHAVAKDDLEPLGLLEWIVTAPQRAFAQSLHQMDVARLRTLEMQRPLTVEERDQLNSARYNAKAGGELGVGDSWFRGSVTGGAQLLANILAGGFRAGQRAIEFGAAGAAGGALAGGLPGAAAGLAGGATVGATYGGLEFGFELESGLAYDEYLDFVDEQGHKIDPGAAKAAALAAGAINAGFEVLGLGILAKTIPGLDKVVGSFGRDAVKQALRVPTVRQALTEAAGGYLGTLTAETATEVAQRAVTIVGEEVAKYATGPEIQKRTGGEIALDLGREALGAAQGFLFVAGPGHLTRVAQDINRAKVAEQNTAIMQALAEGVTQSKVAQRDPEAVEAFLKRATKDGPVERLYVDPATFTEYFQSQNLPPEKVAAELTGRADALEQAQKTGELLSISTATYARVLAGTTHHAGLVLDLRLGNPDAWTERERQAFVAESVAQQVRAAQEADASTPQARALQQFQERLAAANVPRGTIDHYARMYAAGFLNLAERRNVDVEALIDRYDPRFQRPDDAPRQPSARRPSAPKPSPAGASAAAGSPLGTAPAPGAGGESAAAPAPELPLEPGERPPGPWDANTPPAAPGAAAPNPDEPINAMADPVAAAARMMRENPRIIADANALRARAQASRAPAPKRDGTAATPGETTDDGTTRAAAGAELPGGAAEPAAAAAGGAVDAGGEAAGAASRAAQQLPPSARELFSRLAADAVARGYVGDPELLAQQFQAAWDQAAVIAADLNESAADTDFRGVLTYVSKAGGVGVDADPAYAGEINWLLESLSGPGTGIVKKPYVKRGGRLVRNPDLGKRVPLFTAGIAGAPGVIRGKGQGGRSLDSLRETMAEDPRWRFLERGDINDVLRILEDAVLKAAAEQRGQTVKTASGPGHLSVLEGLLGVREGERWWKNQDELEEEIGGDDDGDVSFEPGEFFQRLFGDDLPLFDAAEPGPAAQELPLPASAQDAGPQRIDLGGHSIGAPPANRGDFTPRSVYDASLRTTYFAEDGTPRARTSRIEPQTATIPPLGTWLIDDSFKTDDGHEIQQLIEVPVDQLEISEDTGPDRFGDVERYARWLLEGKEPPPIRILQTDRGTLKTLDHRRLLAAKAVGAKTIKAWVSWAVEPTPGHVVGLTYELAQAGVQPLPITPARPEHTIFQDDARRLAVLKERLAAEGIEAPPAGDDFAAWFAGSVIVDEQGRPRTLYHGTRSAGQIVEFKPSTGGEFGPGIYLAPDPGTADFYASHVALGPEGPATVPVVVSLKNPYRVSKVDWIKLTERSTPSQVQRRLIKKGHDGIIGIGLTGQEQIVAFRPDQVRSAIGVADVLDTGEVQPRLPEAGAVRESEVATPTFEAPFALTSEVAKGPKAQQASLLDDEDYPLSELFQGVGPRGYAVLAPYLTPDEATGRLDHVKAMIVDAFKGLPSDDEYAAVALAGQAARGWYDKSARAIREVFGETDAPRFIGLLAALSPRVSVRQNLENALRMWVNWAKAGRPTTREEILTLLAKSVRSKPGTKGDKSVLESWKNNVVEALQQWDPHNIVLSGPKVQSFGMNLKGYADEVTNDAWMALFAGVEQSVFGGSDRVLQQMGRPKRKIGAKSPRYIAASAKIRRVAEHLTEITGEPWTPAEVQETVWSWTKTLYELATATKVSALSILKQGKLTDAVIAQAPDFDRFLTGDASIRAILELSGYGPQIEAFERARRLGRSQGSRRPGRRRAAESRTGTSGPDRSATVEELRAARRLDRARRNRRISKELEFDQSAIAPDFYSRLTRAVEQSPQARASGAQWKATIKNSKQGVNLEEFALANVEDLDDAQTYTRQEVLDYLEANHVDVREVVLGEPIDQREIRQLAEKMRRDRLEEDRESEDGPHVSDLEGYPSIDVEENNEGGWTVKVNGEEIGDYDDEQEARDAGYERADSYMDDFRAELEREWWSSWEDDWERDNPLRDFLEEAEQELYDGRENERAQYAEYVLLGGHEGSYREVFLTAPAVTTTPFDPAKVEIKRHRTSATQGSVQLLYDGTPLAGGGHYSDVIEMVRAGDWQGKPDEFWIDVARKAAKKEGLLGGWEDGHDSYAHIVNPIVRIRHDLRNDINGNLVMFVQEIQPPQPEQQTKMPRLFTQNWRELGLKWALKQAVESGATKLAWTTGQMQIDLYPSVEQEVREITWGPREGWESKPGVKDGHGTIITIYPKRSERGEAFYIGLRPNGTVESISKNTEPWDGAPLENVIGRELAERIVGESGSLAGEGLRVGGRGLRKLYDVDLPNVAKKLPAVKRAKAEVTTAPLRDRPKRPGTQELDRLLDAHMEARRTLVTYLVQEKDFTGNGANEYVEELLADRLSRQQLEAAQRDELQRDYMAAVLATNRAHYEVARRPASLVPVVTEAPAIEITDALREQVLGGQAYFQADQDRAAVGAGRRGSLKISADRKMVVSLFAESDPSTLLHEGAHMFLEIMQDLAPDTPSIAADLEILRQWAVDDDHAGGGFSRKQHEQIARGFEAYILEGNAPSLGLRDIFAAMKAWLVGVYRVIRQADIAKKLDVELSDEVRGVFDRLLASEDAIAEAQAHGAVLPVFTTAEAAGMSEAEFLPYRQTIEAANQAARTTLEQELLGEVRREQTAEWRRQRDEVTAAVTAEVDAAPVYQALAAMTAGTTPAGDPLVPPPLPSEPLKLSRGIITERLGQDRLKTLPRAILADSGGLDPDLVAERFGFTSGAHLLDAVTEAPNRRRLIADEVHRRMQASSILLDGTRLQEAAQAALSGEEREKVIRTELRALGRLRRLVRPHVQVAQQQGREALREERKERAYERRWFEAEARLRVALERGAKQAEIDVLKGELSKARAQARGGAATIRAALPEPGAFDPVARARIDNTPFGELQPQVFWTAARQAAKAALEAAARQDFDGAITAKHQELLNLALYREARRAKEDGLKRVRQAQALNRPKARARLGKAGGTYLEQVVGVLERFDFAPATGKELRRRAGIVKWVESIQGEGLPVDLPEALLDEALRTHYSNLTVAELRDITDGLQQIVHLSRLKNRLLKNHQRRTLDKVAGAWAASIRANARGLARTVERDRRPEEESKRTVESFFASHRKLASEIREMDGFKDGGAGFEAVLRPLNEAGAAEATMQAEAAKRLHDIVERAFPRSAKRHLYEKTPIKAIGKSFSRMQRIMIALNWGTESNRDRIRKHEGWTDQQVQAILDTLTPAEIGFVQEVTDFVNSYWDQIVAKQKRVTGLAPEKVEASPWRAAGGDVRGGYFPLAYDDRLSAKQVSNMDLTAANLAKQAAYTQATTKRGHVISRKDNVDLPIRHDFGVLFEHVNQVIHDLTHHEALIDIGRVLGHADVQQAIYDHYGDQAYKRIRNVLKDVAFGLVPAVDGFERAVNHIRIGATVAGLGWNLTTAALQPLGLTNSMVRVGPKWVIAATGKFLRHPFMARKTVEWIEERSAFMRARGLTQQREIAEIRTSLGVSTGRLTGWIDEAIDTVHSPITRQAIADSYFTLIQTMQKIADVPTWLAAYEKAMAGGEDEDRAVAMADQAVLDSQGGGQLKDLAGVQRGGPMAKLWSNFYSFFSVLYNQASETKRRTRWSEPASVARAGMDYLLLFVIPATAGKLLRDAMRGRKHDEDDDYLSELFWENLSYMSGLMLGLREISSTIAGGFGYEGPAGARFFAALSRAGQQWRQGEVDEAAVKATADVVGPVLHVPSGQIMRTILGIVALAEGRTDNPAAVLMGPPPKR